MRRLLMPILAQSRDFSESRLSQSSSDVRCMSYLKQSPQAKYTTEDLELRPNTLLDFAAFSQCIRNAFRAPGGSQPVVPH